MVFRNLPDLKRRTCFLRCSSLFIGRSMVPGLLLLCSMAISIGATGCGFDARDALNPAFVDFLGPAVIGSPSGPTSSGHVVIAFRNDTRFDEQLLTYLVEQGLDPTILEDPDLRPRVRMVVQITFVNDETLIVEFNDGSATVIDPAFDASTVPELLETQQDNLVVQCDVSRVNLVGLPSVFLPTFVTTTTFDNAQFVVLTRRDLTIADPRFVQLQVDQVDDLGNPVILRNVGVRNQPAPAVGPNCGSVVTLVMSGTLKINFSPNGAGALVPGFLDTDIDSQEESPGRYQITVGIR